ncbi:ClpP family protease [Microlunatus speluncae]|uniref:ClpP family protease n=1 Tax=Microlunatus speluncae TaxID=2594267 RepID=UPI0012662BFC|nr:ATP-dependent Clp protease proteolytic subunit [Microlunatus speluncae]
MGQYTIPTVVERTPTGERAFDIYSRLLAERIIFLGTEIDDGVANVIIAQLLHLDSASADLDINLHINSPGGSYTAMMAIYDTMQFVRSDVATFCMGQAGAASAVLLAAGTHGKRAALRHSKIMLQQPVGQSRGTLPDLAVQAKEMSRLREEIEEVMALHTGHSESKIRIDSDRDRAFNADEAVAYGLVDQVVTTRKTVDALAR